MQKKRCGGGILPFAIHNDKVYFLFSRERLVFNTHRDRGLYSDFGGSQEKNESPRQVAIREGNEESNGILGNMKKLIKKSPKYIGDDKYRVYLVPIPFDKTLPIKFNKEFKRIYIHFPDRIETDNGLYEKDKLRWIELKKLIKNIKIFRPWYKKYIYQLTRVKKYH